MVSLGLLTNFFLATKNMGSLKLNFTKDNIIRFPFLNLFSVELKKYKHKDHNLVYKHVRNIYGTKKVGGS